MTADKALKQAVRRIARLTGQNYTTVLRIAQAPRRDPNWPCPNGCTEPHDLGEYGDRPPRCFVPVRETRANEPCPDGCLSLERAVEQANPRLRFASSHLRDSACTSCHRCGGFVCVQCQTTPVEDSFGYCDPCYAENLSMMP